MSRPAELQHLHFRNVHFVDLKASRTKLSPPPRLFPSARKKLLQTSILRTPYFTYSRIREKGPDSPKMSTV